MYVASDQLIESKKDFYNSFIHYVSLNHDNIWKFIILYLKKNSAEKYITPPSTTCT
jgi:hypothetical protein